MLVVKYIFSPGTTDTRTGSFMSVTPNQDQSEVYIYMSGDSKNRITSTSPMYTSDNKLIVSAWEAEASFDNSNSKIFIDKWGEVKYEWRIDEKQTISLANADLLADTKVGDVIIKLKNFSVTPSNDTIVILSQNTIASNIYVLKGSATVEDYSKKSASTSVGVGQQLTIMKNDLTNTTLQFESKKEPLSDYIKTTNLFIKHNGDSLLSSLSSTSWTGSGSTWTGLTTSKAAKTGIVITTPEDESTIDTDEVSIEGKILSNEIAKITINDKEALLDKEQKSFLYKNFSLIGASSDIVYKAYDSEGGIIAKGILTVYTSKKTGTQDASKKPTVITYPISDKDFRILSPTENPYKTTDDIIKIEGRVNKGIVKYITVNDFRLSKFVPMWTSWAYFANKSYGTMNDGINPYTIKYYGANDELLFTNLFTIVKEENAPINTAPVPTSESITGTGVSKEG